MTLFDCVVVFVLLISMILGAWRGVLGEIIAVAAWIAAFFAALWWGDALAWQLRGVIDNALLRIIVSWVLIFVIVLLLMALLRVGVRRLLRAIGLSPSDRALGVLFGAVRGLLIVLILVALGGMTQLPREIWWRNAWLSAPLETMVLACRPWLPPEIARLIRFG